MNGRTHEIFGVASSLIILHGAPRKEMVLGCLVASAASTIPDVDLIDNRKRQGIQMVVEVIKQSMIPLGFAFYYRAEPTMILAWIGMMVFMVLQPHRGLSHSVWMLAMTAGLFRLMTRKRLLPWYIVAYASHLLLDMLNTKKVQILYPKGFCMNWVKSGGIADWLIGAMASIVIVVLFAGRIQGLDLVEIGLQEVLRWQK